MKARLVSAALDLLELGTGPHREELEASQWASPDELRDMQCQKLRRLLVHAAEQVPYYRKLFADCALDPRALRLPEDLGRIPFLRREDVQSRFQSLLAENSPARDRILNRTGGSTGSKTLFLNDRRSLPLCRALMVRNDRWTGWSPGGRRALLWASYPDISEKDTWYRRRLEKVLLNRIFLPAREMSEGVMRRHAEALRRFRPELITGYASALALLARYIARNNLRLHPPLGIISSAEALEDGDRKLIEAAFGAPVYDRYGSREICSIAQECRAHEGLHVNAEHVVVEVVDAQGKACGPGETGEIVVTDLDNHVFPFIRYRIGDMGVAGGGRCSCGRGLPLLAKVLGRSFDVITTPDGRYLCISGVRFWTGDTQGIRSFQLVQHDLRTLELRIVAEASFTGAERAKLERRVRERYGGPVEVRITLVDDIPAAESGKHRRVISRISPFAS